MADWRPDWRNADAYPDDLTERQWRWEFLRRCEDYQADFARLHPAYFKAQMETFRGASLPEGVDSWESHFQRIAGMARGAEKYHANHAAEISRAREKYGVQHLLDPAEPEPGLNLFAMTAPYGVGYARKETFAEYEHNNTYLMAFDLNEPLPPQLRKAKAHLMAVQSELVGKPDDRRGQRAKWPRYLRVLDAKAAGARPKEIAAELRLEPRSTADGFDPDRLVSETLRQAHTVQLRFKRIS